MLRIFVNSLIAHSLNTRTITLIFIMWDSIFILSAQTMWHHVEHPIQALKEDRQSSLKSGVCGAFLLVSKSFMSRSLQRLITAEIKTNENASGVLDLDQTHGVQARNVTRSWRSILDPMATTLP